MRTQSAVFASVAVVDVLLTLQAVEMVDTFLNTAFEGGRHATRVDKIACQ